MSARFGTHVRAALKRSRREHSDEFVYFVVAETAGLVRVGRARDPLTRLKMLQTGNHEPLSVVGVLAGLSAAEDALRDEIEMEDQAYKWIEQASALIRDAQVIEGLALLDNALQDLTVSSQTRAYFAATEEDTG